jgi:hypothetical protein
MPGTGCACKPLVALVRADSSLECVQHNQLLQSSIQTCLTWVHAMHCGNGQHFMLPYCSCSGRILLP